MRMTKLLLTIILICNVAMFAPAQRRRSRTVERDVRILKHAPTIYITFEGFGKVGNSLEAQLLETGRASKSQEQGQYIWLRLHNNTRWVIYFPTVDMFVILGGVSVIHPRYQVEERDGTRAPINEIDKQLGTSLRPGRSALFSVLREHFSNGRKIYISFRYSWEDGSLTFGHTFLGEPVHRVEFASDDLSRSAR